MTEPRRIMPLPLGGEHGLPYSRGLMARALMAVGVAPDRAYTLARRVGDELAERGSDIVELDRLGSLAVEILGEVEGTEAVRQLRRYQVLRELDLPIVILVGGATGTGKSTVATEIAYRLGITRERALHEGWSMVLEGVHLVPGLLPVLEDGALVSACVLKIEDETAHAQHFFSREAGTDRGMDKYLDRFHDIRRLQELIVERAQREGVAVIENTSADRATRAVAELVLSAAERTIRERV